MYKIEHGTDEINAQFVGKQLQTEKEKTKKREIPQFSFNWYPVVDVPSFLSYCALNKLYFQVIYSKRPM